MATGRFGFGLTKGGGGFLATLGDGFGETWGGVDDDKPFVFRFSKEFCRYVTGFESIILDADIVFFKMAADDCVAPDNLLGLLSCVLLVDESLAFELLLSIAFLKAFI